MLIQWGDQIWTENYDQTAQNNPLIVTPYMKVIDDNLNASFMFSILMKGH